MEIKTMTAQKPNNEVRTGITFKDTESGRIYTERVGAGVITYTKNDYKTLKVVSRDQAAGVITVQCQDPDTAEYPVMITLNVSKGNLAAESVDAIFDMIFEGGAVPKVQRFKILGYRFAEQKEVIEDAEEN